jgi:adenylate cyclase
MVEEGVTRKLAAILATDVVGYSRLMSVDETGTLARMTAHLDEVFKPAITKHQGHVVKTTGDGLLAEFSSAVEVVKCAVQIQTTMAERSKCPSGKLLNFDNRHYEFHIVLSFFKGCTRSHHAR